jgi:hypothetical protein
MGAALRGLQLVEDDLWGHINGVHMLGRSHIRSHQAMSMHVSIPSAAAAVVCRRCPDCSEASAASITPGCNPHKLHSAKCSRWVRIALANQHGTITAC